jgi:hypothetical protein
MRLGLASVVPSSYFALFASFAVKFLFLTGEVLAREWRRFDPVPKSVLNPRPLAVL